MAVLGGAGGHFVSWGPVLSVRDPTDKKNCFGRNSAPPGSFREIFGSSEARLRCATFVQPRLPMVRPPAVAICDFLVLGGLGDLQKFRGPVQGPKLAKNAKKLIFPVFGAALG